MNFPSPKPTKYSQNSRYEKATRRQKGHFLGQSNTKKGQTYRWPKVVSCKSRGAQPLKNKGTICKAKKKGKVNSTRHRYQAILNNPENKVDLMQRSSWEERRVTGKGVPSRPITKRQWIAEWQCKLEKQGLKYQMRVLQSQMQHLQSPIRRHHSENQQRSHPTQ